MEGMERTDLICVSLDVHRYMIARLRAMTPEERIRIAIQRMELGWEIHRLAMGRLRARSGRKLA